MNIQEYISSGIIESYVLGLADEAETAEFERMCATHPELRTAMKAFELSLEDHATRNAIQPSKNIKSKIFSEIQIEIDKNNREEYVAPVYTIGKDSSNVPVVANVSWQRYLAAASVVLLIGSTALNLYFFNQYRTYSSKYDELLSQQSQLASHNGVLQSKLAQYENSFSLMRNPGMAIIKMPGTNVPTSPDPSCMATIYWDTSSRDVYLLVNKLPQPSADQQYQLWAIVDGKPVDAGIFDWQNEFPMVRMKNIPRAQQFAITLERKGGNVSPQGPMYVAGKV